MSIGQASDELEDASEDTHHNLTVWIMEQIARTHAGTDLNHTGIRVLVHNLTTLLVKLHAAGMNLTAIWTSLSNPDDETYWARVVENRRVGCVSYRFFSNNPSPLETPQNTLA